MVDDRAAGDRADVVGQPVAVRPGVRLPGDALERGAEDQPGLLLRQRGAGRTEDPLEEVQRRGVDLLDHPGADDDRSLVHAGRQPVQLVLQQGEALRYPHEQYVDPLGRGLLGGEKPDRGRPGTGRAPDSRGSPPAPAGSR